jgi:hypothetical protein
MKSDSSTIVGADIDLGLFEDVLLNPGASSAPPAQHQPPSAAPSEPNAAPAVSRAEIVTIPADVQLLTLERGEYSLTIPGYSAKKPNSRPQPLAAADVAAVPGQAADAVTVVSTLKSPPPWPYDRDLILSVTVVADSATLSVIVYRPEGLAASALRVEKLR